MPYERHWLTKTIQLDKSSVNLKLMLFVLRDSGVAPATLELSPISGIFLRLVMSTIE